MSSNPVRRAPLTHTAHRFITEAVEHARAATKQAADAPNAGEHLSSPTATQFDSGAKAEPQLTPSHAVQLLAIDATAGNGHDTLFLARLLGAGGEVAAFDIQQAALQSTAERLQAYVAIAQPPALASPVEQSATQEPNPAPTNSLAHVRLIQGSHADMLGLLPVSWRGKVCVITFNLGYLPGADKGLVTETHSTLPALNAALQFLCPGGLLSVMCYRGHPQGILETEAITNWLPTLPTGFTHSFTEAFSGAPAHAPILLRITKNT